MKRKLLCLAAACSCFIVSVAQTPSARPDAATLEFVENQGQWPAPVRYTAEVPGGRLFLEPGGLTYSLLAGVPHGHDATKQPPAATAEIRAHALRVVFAGAATQPTLSAETQTRELRNYLRGNDPGAWAQNVPSFRQVRYAGIWPGIGARFYENQSQQLEYDFELAADADPASIQLRYEGADALTLSAAGSLEIRTSLGVLRELAPQAWQTDAVGRRQPVACAYTLKGRTVSFRLGPHDRHQPLTIDPTVVFSTYTGSTADNWGFTATYDAQGNMYSGGIVFGAGYPVTTGAFSTTFGGVIDISIIKYNTATTGAAARVWATYIGGAEADFPHSMVVNSRGELTLLGTTGSSNYPTTSTAYDRSFNGGTLIAPTTNSSIPGSDLVVTRLSADGARLVGSTYLGGSGNDGILAGSNIALEYNYGDTFRGDILLDASDNIYLASNTTSTNFPVTNGLGGSYRGGSHDAVVCKLNATASTLLWSSFLGGSGTDAAYTLQLSPAGHLYVSGGTTSSNFPTTPGSLHPAALGGVDGFVACISSTGTQIRQATYLGTSAYDQSYFLQLDGSGAVYVLGQSLGSYPVTAGRYQNPGSRQFIHKLSADLSATSFSTVFGSGRASIDISPTAFLVDECNRIYVSGWGGRLNSPSSSAGGTTGLPVTPNAVQRTTDGDDFYLFQLAPDATRLDYATFFGQAGGSGDHVDGGTSRFDPRGVVYQAVCACGRGSGFPVPPGAGSYSATSGSSNCNNAAFKLNFETINVVAGTDRNVCVAAAPQPLIGSPAGGVWTGPGVSGSLASGFLFTPTTALLGTQTLTYTVTGVGPCGGVSSLRLTVVPSPTAAFAPGTPTSLCLNAAPSPLIQLSATPAGGTFSGPGVSGSSFNPAFAGPGTHTLIYNVNANGCVLQATHTVTVIQAVAPPGFTVCSNGAATPLAGAPAGGTWAGPGVSGSVSAGFVFTPSAALRGTQILTYTVAGAGGCTSTATLAVEVQPASPVVPTTLPAYCTSTTTPVALPSAAAWFGQGVRPPSGGIGFTFTPSLAGAGTFLLTYRTGFGACETSGTVPVTVFSPASISLPPDTVLCPGATQPFRLRASPAGGSWSGLNVTSAGLFTPPAGFAGSATLTYTVTVGACVSTATRRVSVAPPPTYEARWTPELCATTRQAPLAVRFSDPQTPTADVRWDFGDGTQGSGNAAGHVYARPGRYQPKIIRTYNNGRCSIELSLPVLEVEQAYQIPNIITPNGDLKNEYFRATNGCPARLQVFSRWGSKVFEAASYRNDWNGGKLPAGVYYYHLQHTDGASVKGWVEIAR